MENTLMLISLNPSIFKMKFGEILLCCMTNISKFFLLNARDWKLVRDYFMISLK